MSSTSSSKPRAFILTRELNFDFTPLEREYEIVELAGSIRAYNVLGGLRATQQMIDDAIAEKDFSVDRGDALVLAGPGPALAITAAMLSAWYPSFNVLVFDARNSTYALRVFANLDG